ncbi:AMP-binding protein, partial [Streptomyces sp. NPDC051909]|uniref:AMP-binding protein n=1 Tax=Streptomyces sp. NPDC051909 TaxID=3154944 RepID=UPI00342C37F2
MDVSPSSSATYPNFDLMADPICDYPECLGIHQLVDDWAGSRPSAIAVMDSHISLTYSELVMRANRLAHYLLGRGVERGDRVGVRLPRGVSTVVAFLAVLKAGAAFVPMDPAYPASRLAYLAEDCGAVVVLDKPLLDAAAGEIAEQPETAPAVQVGGSDLAYVMYTSGSTGQPKGVQVEHRSIVDLITGADYADLGSDAQILHCVSPSFDVSNMEIWGALLSGARLVIAPAGPPVSEVLGDLIR